MAKDSLKLKKYKNCFYFGQVLNSCRYGKGIMIFNDSCKIYEGDWENNLKHGSGYEVY